MKKIFILIIIAASLTACKKVFFTAEPENTPTNVFNEFWKSFDELYGPFEERGVDWDAVYAQYSPLVNDNISDDSLFTILSSMIATLNDGHVTLTAPDRKSFSSNRVYRDSIGFNLFDLDVIEQEYLDNTFTGNDSIGYVYGLINDDILYAFFPFISDNMPIMDNILDSYPDVKGMIIDLRHSFGGDFSWGLEYFSRFTTEDRFVFSSSTKNGTGDEDFGAWYDWNLKSSGKYFDKKIVFLTDRYTISASERSVMALKVIPNTVQIGDTTNGSHSTQIGRELQNGWYYTLATQRVTYADGYSYEGIGMIPNIVVKNFRSHLDQGIDDVLNAAINELQ